MKISPASPPTNTPAEWIDETAPGALESLRPPAPPSPSSGRTLLLLAALLLGGAAGFWLRDHQNTPLETVVVANSSTPARTAVVVHVAGRVHRPGVYDLPSNARVRDAIARAGGALPDADSDTLNLAAIVEDGKKIEVPPRNQTDALQSQVESPDATSIAPLKARTTPSKYRREPKNATPVGTTMQPREPLVQPSQSNTGKLVDLNRATATELEALPGIGPALASRIIAYRAQNGGFANVDDLDAVDGIGEKKMESLRNLVEVR